MLTNTFQVGNFRCTVLGDGMVAYDFAKLQMRFPAVAEADLIRANQAIGIAPDAQTTYYNPLLIQTDTETILVDAGDTRHESAGRTMACLAAVGVQPAAVDLVVITHAHGDHTIGLFNDDQTLRYPNARYLIHADEYAFWVEKNPLLKQLQPLDFIDMDAEIVTGVRPIAAYGHTVGHIGLLLASEGERFVHGVDLVHHLMQFAHPNWTIKFDTNADQARASRLRLFDWLADERLLTLFYHLPFPGLGYVRRSGEAFAWEAIDNVS